jgi:hypothetical protein
VELAATHASCLLLCAFIPGPQARALPSCMLRQPLRRYLALRRDEHAVVLSCHPLLSHLRGTSRGDDSDKGIAIIVTDVLIASVRHQSRDAADIRCSQRSSLRNVLLAAPGGLKPKRRLLRCCSNTGQLSSGA